MMMTGRITIKKDFSIEEKVAFLKEPGSYPADAVEIITKETHMSWIFLVGNLVYKLKKPVKYQYLDHRSIESRFRDCRMEIRLNSKLAEGIYLGLVPITVNNEGKLRLSGNGEIVDWLIKMKRIPEIAMLDYSIRNNCIDAKQLKKAALLLTDFYKSSVPVTTGEEEYRRKMEREIINNYKQLILREFQLNEAFIERLTNAQLKFVSGHKELFGERISRKKIIEAHGDLKPEHVCLTDPPVIFDRLEFSRDLRILDVAEELSYFAMECEILDNPRPGNLFFETYEGLTADNINESLIRFYKIKRACLRAFLVIRHITEPNYKTDNGWIVRAKDYLKLAEGYSAQI